MSDIKTYSVHSQKYDINGIIKDYGVVTKLHFSYQGNEVEIAIRLRTFDSLSPEEQGEMIIDSYIEKLAPKKRKLMLHYFFINKRTDENGDVYYQAHGRITGHPNIADSSTAHTSYIETLFIDEAKEELIVITHSGSTYHCPLIYCDYEKQMEFPDIIPDFENIKSKYSNSIPKPSIDKGKILLVLSDFDSYYFNSLYYVPETAEEEKTLPVCSSAHIGMFQDSFLIFVEETEIDIRYYPHYKNIEFYSQNTEDKPLYIENIGSSTIYAKAFCGVIRLEPGERKFVSEENTEKKKAVLPSGDLYPAGIEE